MMVLNGFKTPKKSPGLGMIHSTKDMRYAFKKNKWPSNGHESLYVRTTLLRFVVSITYLACLRLKFQPGPAGRKYLNRQRNEQQKQTDQTAICRSSEKC